MDKQTEFSEKIRVVRINRYAKEGHFIGGYIQAENEANVILDEITEAEIGEKWEITLLEMPKQSYENLPEFQGF